MLLSIQEFESLLKTAASVVWKPRNLLKEDKWLLGKWFRENRGAGDSLSDIDAYMTELLGLVVNFYNVLPDKQRRPLLGYVLKKLPTPFLRKEFRRRWIGSL